MCLFPMGALTYPTFDKTFFTLRFFEVLIKLYYSLSTARSPNLRSASTLLIVNQLFADCPETPFRREKAERLLERALLVL
jgi:hypothetical protein